MGKSFCKIEKKWCKFLKHNICLYCTKNIFDINRCPRLFEIETIRLATILQEVTFEDVFKCLIRYFTDQEVNKDAYLSVFNTLLEKKPKKHNLDDLFICVEKSKDDFSNDDREYLNTYGINVINHTNIRYGLEFCEWIDWISMFITKETLKTLSKEEIVASCLYEMTFFGFCEEKVKDEKQTMINRFEDLKSWTK